MWTEIPKGKNKKPVNKDRFISKMFLRWVSRALSVFCLLIISSFLQRRFCNSKCVILQDPNVSSSLFCSSAEHGMKMETMFCVCRIVRRTSRDRLHRVHGTGGEEERVI